MFKRRFSKFGRAFFLVACLFFVSGLQQSCKDWLDDYKYDDSEPDWLGESIYAFLQEGSPNHTYRNYVELINSLGERETLERTGSKTLFVADDAAFERFYANNAWGVKSVADMTVAQRKFLFYNTMLPNAILLDMMPNSSDNVDNRGDVLTRSTEFNQADSITLLHAKYYKMYETWPIYNKYWNFSDKDTANFAMASSSMVHFFDEYLSRNAISETDVDFIFSKVEDAEGTNKKSYKNGDVYLFGNKLVNSDVESGNFSEDVLTIVCKNGYLYRMDDVLLPPMDMASELRVHEDTKIFSYLLDRFSFPVINADVTDKYNEITAKIEKDTVYSLRYLTKDVVNGVTNAGMIVDPLHTTNKIAAPAAGEYLKYDPAEAPSTDNIYAIFATKDDVLYKYFAEEKNDNGNFLIKKFAPEVNLAPDYSESAVGTLLEALNAVPQISIATILNNLMQNSFASSVPSKFDRLVDDANDVMGIEKQDVDECIIASNGVVYLLNKMFYPAKHSSVIGPVEIHDNMSIINRFIIANRYDYYLLAMDADYSLIVPDSADFVYYNPLTIEDTNKKQRVYLLHYDDKREKNNQDAPELWYDEYEVSTETFEIIKSVDQKTLSGTERFITDLLEYLVVVHDKSDPSIRPDRLYYTTKGNGTVKIDASDPEHIKFYGGEQLEKGREIVDAMQIAKKNGMTYCTTTVEQSTETLLQSSVPTPPTKSVYDNMLAYGNSEGDLYYEFFQLCNPGSAKMKTIINNILEVEDVDTIKMYSIFYTDGDNNNYTMKNCVPFFNTFHYTVYIPSNDAINELYAQGLPTWELIEKESAKNPQRAMSMLRLLNSFARHHFQDQSIYHDRYRRPNTTLSTSVINAKTGRFYELDVMSADDNSTILIQDEWAKLAQDQDWATVNNTDLAELVITSPEDENKTWNVMCRDIVRKGTNIETSSFSVLQPINRALLNNSMFGYDSRFQRFVETGERVDTMRVAGGKDGKAGFGDEFYLVAKAGRVPHTTENVEQPEELENAEIAFLMEPIDSKHKNWESSMCREIFVYESTGNSAATKQPILITRDGYLVDRTEVKVGKEIYYRYSYRTVTEADGDYIIKVNNAGEEIAKDLFKAKEVEAPDTENNDSDVDNGSNAEANDKE